jgi:uncharacterized protein YdaU (DUF1376 family)
MDLSSRRNGHAMLDDMLPLSNAERGAYCTVLALIQARDGRIDDDDRFIAGWCRLSLADWRRIRARLIALEKLYEDDGTLRSLRADREVDAARRRCAAAQAAGRASGRLRAAPSENKHLPATPVAGEAPIDRARAEARAEQKAHIAAKDPYEAQTLVADLLQAMGHVTAVAPPGADGGTDILAYPGPFGAGTPHLRVQVKHRSARATREEIAALRGILAPEREIGLFVSFGGFTAPGRRESGTPHIRLIDLDDFLDLWIAHYDALSEAARDRLPLAPVWFLKRNDTAQPLPRHPEVRGSEAPEPRRMNGR